MDARLIVSDELKHQVSTKTKLLKWIQENPHLCYDTNLANIARTITHEGGNEVAVRVRLNQLVADQMLLRSGGKRRANFQVNYFHPNLPMEVLDHAPDDIKAEVEQFEEARHKLDQQIVEQAGKLEEVSKPEESEEVEEAEKVEEPITIKQTEDGITININLTIKVEK